MFATLLTKLKGAVVPVFFVAALVVLVLLFGRSFLPGMETILTMLMGVFLLAFIIFVYLTVTKGVPWATTTLVGWWNAGKADLANAKNDIATLQKDVAAIKNKLGGLA